MIDLLVGTTASAHRWGPWAVEARSTRLPNKPHPGTSHRIEGSRAPCPARRHSGNSPPLPARPIRLPFMHLALPLPAVTIPVLVPITGMVVFVMRGRWGGVVAPPPRRRRRDTVPIPPLIIPGRRRRGPVVDGTMVSIPKVEPQIDLGPGLRRGGFSAHCQQGKKHETADSDDCSVHCCSPFCLMPAVLSISTAFLNFVPDRAQIHPVVGLQRLFLRTPEDDPAPCCR